MFNKDMHIAQSITFKKKEYNTILKRAKERKSNIQAFKGKMFEL
jgi:hypothetical protein